MTDTTSRLDPAVEVEEAHGLICRSMRAILIAPLRLVKPRI